MYQVPIRETFERPRTNALPKEKYKSFVDIEVKKRAWVPGFQHNTQDNWSAQKYRFSAHFKKFDRKTMTVDVINQANKDKIPATGCYDGANRSLMHARRQATSGDKQDRVLRNVSEA